MLELLILISYLNLSNFPVDIYYQEEISKYTALSDDFLIVGYRYGEYFLYLESGKNLTEWSNESFNDNFRTLLAREVQKSARAASGRRAGEGFIPDIDLNLKMPRGLSAILGEGGHIKVSGFEEIKVEIEQNRQTWGTQGTYSSIPQIILDQRLKAQIKGTIGEKLHVDIDHDSEKAEKDNVMKIWYGGGVGVSSEVEDDIIQELNLGRIEESGREKLFGIATRGKIGSTSFSLSAGKLESDAVTGSNAVSISSGTIIKNEGDYEKNYFYTGLPHRSDILKLYRLYRSGTPSEGPWTTLVEFDGTPVPEITPFTTLTEGVDYVYGELTMKDGTSLPYFHLLKSWDSKMIGVYLEFFNSVTGRLDTLGDITGDTLTLYQLKKSQETLPSDLLWYYQMRNIYRFGGDASNIQVKISKVVGTERYPNIAGDTSYAYLLGITDEDGNILNNQIITEEGCIVFPDSLPFLNPELHEDTISLLYRKTKAAWSLEGYNGNNFEIEITSTSTSSSPGNFRLQSSGTIIEGSEKLTVEGGEALMRGTDYTINYITGEVELIKVLPSDARIEYTFDYEPFFSFDSKYKAGLNIETTPIEDGKLNIDLGFLSRSDKGVFHPSMGKEPSNITLGKMNFSLKKEPEFLSEAFGKLPLVDEDSKSHFNIDGSYGFSLPNPAANGKSYLDDMESVDLPVSVNLGARAWYYCSQPDDSVNIDDLARLDWFTNSYYPKSRIFSDYASTYSSDRWIRVLEFYFRPDNINNWGGIMRTFNRNGQGHNFFRKNFLEVWVKAQEDGGTPADGEMIFEMGNRMDEDLIRWGRNSAGYYIIPPNGELDEEDKNHDGILQSGEDTGLDTVAGDDADLVPGDDGVDDYVMEPDSFTDSLKMHNKEGNNTLDSEDLNGDYSLGTQNHFFRYRIDLSSSSPYLAKQGLNGWKVFILPLKDTSVFEKIGSPSFENVSYTRVWFSGMDKNTRITIGKIDIVGNKWEDKGIRSVSNDALTPSSSPCGYFKAGSRNTLEDEDYIPPVERVKETGTYAYQKEQSLTLEVDYLLPGNYCAVENYLELPIERVGKGYDFRLYDACEFYTRYEGTDSDSAEVFLRLLTDSVNYYQFKTFAYPDDWDTINVVFDEFTDLKISGDTAEGVYSLKGNPSLQSIISLQLGVVNNSGEMFKGEVLIDDIFLKGADNRMGSNLDLSISTNVGDLITGLSYDIVRKSSNYKSRLDALRELGDREENSNAFRVTADAGKFLNKVVNCPVTLSIRDRQGTPIYRVNSDVALPPEEAESLTDEAYSRDLTFSLSRPSNSDNWFLKNTIEKLKLSGSYRKSETINPLRNTDTVTSTTGSVSYSLPLPKLSLPVLASSTTSLLPLNIQLRSSYEYSESRKYKYQDSIYERENAPLKKQIKNSAELTYNPIRWIDLDYSINTTHDLRERESFSENRSLRDLGRTASLKEEISAAHRSDQFGLNNLNITYKTTFSQNHGIEYSKTLSDTGDVRGVTQQRTIRINDNLQLGSILQKIPLISRFSKNISPVKFSANFTKDGAFAYLNSMPDYRFRYGWDWDLLPDSSLFVDKEITDGGYFNEIYSMSSGFSSTKLNLKLNWMYSIKRPDDLKREKTLTPKRTIKRTWPLPDVDVELPNIQKYIPFLGRYVRRANFSLSFSKDSLSVRSLGVNSYSEGTSSINISPVLDLDFKNGLGVNATYRASKNRTYPDSKNNSYGETKGLSINCDYRLKPSNEGFPLLFFGRVKFDKPVAIKATFNYTRRLNYTDYVYGTRSISTDERSIECNLRGDYTFSDMVTGGLKIEFSYYKNYRLENSSSISYGGEFNVRINF